MQGDGQGLRARAFRLPEAGRHLGECWHHHSARWIISLWLNGHCLITGCEGLGSSKALSGASFVNPHVLSAVFCICFLTVSSNHVSE